MRILGLDLGSKTLGVAISDELGWTAQGIETIKINEENRDYNLKRLSEIIQESFKNMVLKRLFLACQRI
jgi:putative Holliday junction resolvase